MKSCKFRTVAKKVMVGDSAWFIVISEQELNSGEGIGSWTEYNRTVLKKSSKVVIVEDQQCSVCSGYENPSKTVLCDGCDSAFHIYCLTPKLFRIPRGNWFCTKCVTDEMVTDEMVTDEMVNDEMVTDEMVTEEIVTEEIVTEEIVTDENIAHGNIDEDDDDDDKSASTHEDVHQSVGIEPKPHEASVNLLPCTLVNDVPPPSLSNRSQFDDDNDTSEEGI